MDGIDLKLSRAKKHLDDFDRLTAEYFASVPYTLEWDDDPAVNERRTVIRVHHEPTAEMALTAADVIHNARAALDHLACSLVTAGGGVPSESTYFPVTTSSYGWSDKARKSLNGAALSARSNIKELQPWKGGNDDLWLLHHLDIVDKHRTLLVVLAHYRGVILGGHEWAPFPDDPEGKVTFPELFL